MGKLVKLLESHLAWSFGTQTAELIHIFTQPQSLKEQLLKTVYLSFFELRMKREFKA